MAKVFLIKQKNRDGEIYFSKTYYFKTKIGKSRKNINTFSSNRRTAEKIANDYEINRILPVGTSPTSNSLANLIQGEGWTVPANNPKYLKALAEGRNYGITQATKIAQTFNHLLDKEEKLKEWEKFIEYNDILDTSKFNHFTSFLFKTKASELTRTSAMRFINFLREYLNGVSKLSQFVDNPYFIPNLRMCVISLKAFFTFSVESGVLTENIFHNIKIPTTKKIEKKSFLTMEQIKILFNDDFAKHIDKNFYNSPFYRALKFAALTGMRSAEIRALQYHQFDKQDNHILIVNQAFKQNNISKETIGLPKWDKARIIYLSDSALECVGKIGKPDDFVFSTRKGTALGSGRFGNLFGRYLEGVEAAYRSRMKMSFLDGVKYTPHSLRGSLNSYLVGSGKVGEMLIQEYFGWTRTALTAVQRQHYTQFDAISAFSVANAIEEGFSGNTMKEPIITTNENTKLTDMMEKIMNKPKPASESLPHEEKEFGTFKYATELLNGIYGE